MGMGQDMFLRMAISNKLKNNPMKFLPYLLYYDIISMGGIIMSAEDLGCFSGSCLELQIPWESFHSALIDTKR